MRHTSLPPRLESESVDLDNYEEDEDVQMHSDSEQVLLTSMPPNPPAHLAARFNRSGRASRSTSSRKSSASSSRRNSLSSLQSGRSNLSCHGGPFSTHVAQHLRRASIIDARRARLAERAVYAEQVRLRALAVKAAPRISRSAEERALAAREAREKHLAQVAATCAEEVKRAKRIAEDMKEKKEKEEERLRAEMEEKHASAERRRQVFERQRELRRRRGSSNTRSGGLSAVQERRIKLPTWKPKNRDIAARVIQKAWRECRLRLAVAEFLRMELNIEHVQVMSFEDASDLLMQEQITATTEKFLHFAHVLNPAEDETAKSARIRIFLSSFLVYCHPQQVLSNHGPQEEDLINKAKFLLMELQRLTKTSPPTLSAFSSSSARTQSFLHAQHEFQVAFEAWKAGDQSMMIDTMVLQFVELDAIAQTTKNDTTGGVADDYRQGVKQNQTMILARLKRLIGKQEAMRLLSGGVNKRRQEDAAKARALRGKPRGTPASSGGTPIMAKSRARTDPARSRDAVFSSRDLAQVIAPLPENRTLVHELALDREWRMDAEKTRQVRQTIRHAMLQTIREDLITGNGDYWILNMIETIREKLLRTVIRGGSMHKMLSENLDTELIEQQLSNGSFSHERFFNYMSSVLPKLVSPARDADVREFARDTNSDFTERLEKLFRIIDFLSLDYANFMLQQSAPRLIQTAPSYEHDCFNDEYGPSTLNIPKTKAWWRAARTMTVNDIARRPASPPSTSSMTTPPPTPPRGSPLPLTVKPTAERIYTTGIVDLFIGLPVASLSQDTPETLHLDMARIAEARASVQRIIATSTVLLTAKNALKRDVRTPWRNVAQRMWDIAVQAEEQAKNKFLALDSSPLDLEAVATGFMVAIESAQVLPPAVKNALSGTIRRVLAETIGSHATSPSTKEIAGASPAHHQPSQQVSHPVLRVLLNKLRANVLGRVLGGEEERKRKEGAAAEALATAGMVEHVERVRAIVDTLQRVKRVDWDAHKTWLNKVREEADAEANHTAKEMLKP